MKASITQQRASEGSGDGKDVKLMYETSINDKIKKEEATTCYLKCNQDHILHCFLFGFLVLFPCNRHLSRLKDSYDFILTFLISFSVLFKKKALSSS